MTLIYNNQTQSQNIHILSDYLHSVGKKVTQLALPALGIIALSCIPTAEGIPIGYVAIAGAAGIPDFPACIKGCLPKFLWPIP